MGSTKQAQDIQGGTIEVVLSPAAVSPAYRTAESLERFLKHPLESEHLLSFHQAIVRDEAESYPLDAMEHLNEWGLCQYHVPVEMGGKCGNWEELLAMMRVIARRDLTVAIAQNVSFLAAGSVWVAGSQAVRERVAELLKAGEPMAFGMSERDHGSDLLATEVRAVRTEEGYRLTGEKWLVGNSTRGAAMTVFARTEEAGGARGFSIFLVDKERLDRQSFSYLEKVRTMGLRGLDLSGIRYEGTLLPADAVVGRVGAGLELVLKALQVTRTMCGGLALGAADTALRATLDFALNRHLYSGTVFEIPHARETLADAFLDLLLCDCVMISAARALHVVPEQMPLWAAIVKYWVPTRVETVFQNLSVIMGARFYMREGHWSGIFQKAYRDAGIISIFEGNTLVQLNMIALELRHLLNNRVGDSGDRRMAEVREHLPNLYHLQQALPPFRYASLDLYSRGKDDAVHGLGAALPLLEGLRTDPGVSAEVIDAISGYVQAVTAELDRLADDVPQHANLMEKSVEVYGLAKRLCDAHAAATCVLMWLYNRHELGTYFANGEWLVLALQRLLGTASPTQGTALGGYRQRLVDHMLQLHAGERLFSVVPFQLATKQES